MSDIRQPTIRICGPGLPSDPFTLSDGITALRRIEYFGRISHRSEEAQTVESYKRFIPAVVIGKGDYSIIEHYQLSVEMDHDRGIQQEITRHRLGSYVEGSFTIESTRFVNYAKKILPSFIYPRPKDDVVDSDWLSAVEFMEAVYMKLIAKGWPPQEARTIFPLALNSKMIMTENLRSWRHFLIMRTTREAHPQLRQVSIPLLKMLKATIPYLFDDIEPMEFQAKAILKAK